MVVERKHQDSSRVQPGAAEMDSGPLLPRLRELASTLRAQVALAAGGEAGVEVVHALRTGTRRIEALMEPVVRKQTGHRIRSSGYKLERSARRWLRHLKRLRRAAAPVRDLDVHRKLLAAVTAADERLAQQAGPLERWLRKARAKHALRLERRAKKLAGRLERAEARFLKLAARGSHEQHHRRKHSRAHDSRNDDRITARNLAEPAWMLALRDFAHLSQSLPELDVANLHEFRKGAKKARYLSETSTGKAAAVARSATAAGAATTPAPGSQPAHEVARQLRKLQDRIGAWHDWLVLAEEGARALGDDAAALRSAIEREREHSYARAMATSEEVRARLLAILADQQGKQPSK